MFKSNNITVYVMFYYLKISRINYVLDTHFLTFFFQTKTCDKNEESGEETVLVMNGEF